LICSDIILVPFCLQPRGLNAISDGVGSPNLMCAFKLILLIGGQTKICPIVVQKRAVLVFCGDREDLTPHRFHSLTNGQQAVCNYAGTAETDPSGNVLSMPAIIARNKPEGSAQAEL
jgi:hypothetical protein